MDVVNSQAKEMKGNHEGRPQERKKDVMENGQNANVVEPNTHENGWSGVKTVQLADNTGLTVEMKGRVQTDGENGVEEKKEQSQSLNGNGLAAEHQHEHKHDIIAGENGHFVAADVNGQTREGENGLAAEYEHNIIAGENGHFVAADVNGQSGEGENGLAAQHEHNIIAGENGHFVAADVNGQTGEGENKLAAEYEHKITEGENGHFVAADVNGQSGEGQNKLAAEYEHNITEGENGLFVAADVNGQTGEGENKLAAEYEHNITEGENGLFVAADVNGQSGEGQNKLAAEHEHNITEGENGHFVAADVNGQTGEGQNGKATAIAHGDGRENYCQNGQEAAGDGGGLGTEEYSLIVTDEKGRRADVGMAVILVGNAGVGKTSIMNRYINDTFKAVSSKHCGDGDLRATPKITHVRGRVVELSFVDGSGLHEVKDQTIQNLRNYRRAILMVYDVTNMRSFKSLGVWLKRIEQNHGDDIDADCCLVMGNKIDLQGARKVPYELVEDWLIQNKITHYEEVSAKEDIRVKEGIDQLVERVLNRIDASVRVQADGIHGNVEGTAEVNNHSGEGDGDDDSAGRRRGCCSFW